VGDPQKKKKRNLAFDFVFSPKMLLKTKVTRYRRFSLLSGFWSERGRKGETQARSVPHNLEMSKKCKKVKRKVGSVDDEHHFRDDLSLALDLGPIL
jgi:hypothetical protein